MLQQELEDSGPPAPLKGEVAETEVDNIDLPDPHSAPVEIEKITERLADLLSRFREKTVDGEAHTATQSVLGR